MRNDSQYAEAQAEIQAGEEGLVTYRAELDKGWAGYQTLLNTIEALKAQAEGGSGQDPDQENPNQDQELLQKIQVMELQAQETKKTLDAKEQDYQTQRPDLMQQSKSSQVGKLSLTRQKRSWTPVKQSLPVQPQV